MFMRMKVDAHTLDVIAYATMIHAYDTTAENWKKASALFQEMEANDVIPNSIA